MISYEYMQFLNEKILEYLPKDFIRIGDKLNGRCPICGDSHKSSTKKRGWFYLSNCSYYCFNCGTGLSGIKFLQMLSGEDYDDIKKEYLRLFLKSNLHSSLSSYFDKPAEEPSIFEMKSIVKPEWKKPLTKKAMDYLNGRRVLDAPFLKEDLYSCYGSGEREYIMIPWMLNGINAYYQLNDFLKYGPIKYIFPKNRKKLVYGLDNIDLSWPYIIVFEGVYDSLFVKNSVAVGTKSITDYQLKLMHERYPNHRICISFDNDTPGMQSMQKIVEKGKDFIFLKWFDENTAAKDVNEQVLASGDIRQFADPARLESMMITPLQLKMWLLKNGKWEVPAKKPFKAFKSGGRFGCKYSLQ